MASPILKLQQEAGATLGEAYGVQDAYVALLRESGRGAMAGYKVGVTTLAMQKMVGIDQPIAGEIFADVVYGSPATLEGADYVRLGLEGEIAVRLGADLPAAGAPYDRDVVAAAVAACAPAFELIDDRNADYGNLSITGIVADNAWNAGIVLGEWVAEWRDLDLVAARGAMTLAGAEVTEGRGGDVLGHPLESVVWLANGLAARGRHLARDMVVMTGCIGTTQFPKPGEQVAFAVDGLGEASLSVG